MFKTYLALNLKEIGSEEIEKWMIGTIIYRIGQDPYTYIYLVRFEDWANLNVEFITLPSYEFDLVRSYFVTLKLYLQVPPVLLINYNEKSLFLHVQKHLVAFGGFLTPKIANKRVFEQKMKSLQIVQKLARAILWH